MSENTPNKPKKFRSPNYPFIGLEDAIKKAGDLQKHGGLHEVPFRAAMDAWDYKTGSTQQTIAALKSFGLVTVSGESESRKIKLTDTARKILADHSSERAELIKEAALSPAIYRDLWTKYEGSLPPSDKIIAEYLEFEKLFNPDVIKGVIKDFRATITFANLSTSDKIDRGSEVGGDFVNTGNAEQGAQEGLADSGAKIRKAMELPTGIMFRASLEMDQNGRLDVKFAGGSDRKIRSLVNDLYDLCDKYDPQPAQGDFTISTEPAQLPEGQTDDE